MIPKVARAKLNQHLTVKTIQRITLALIAFAGSVLHAATFGTAVTNTGVAAPGFATIRWTPPTPGFTLQSTDNFSPTNWINAPSGTNNPAIVPAPLPARFYRLFKP